MAINGANGPGLKSLTPRIETIKGSISLGKLADFVVLADDPHTVDASKIKDIQIVQTVVGGITVYQG